MNIFSIKCYFRANLKIDVTKNRILWGISQVKLKSEIHSPGNFLLLSLIVLTDPTTSTCPGAPDCFVKVHQGLICLLTSLCNHQEIIDRRPEQICRLHLTQDWSGPGGRYSSRTQINAGVQNGTTIQVTLTIIEVRPADLGQMWHPPGNHK